MAKKTGKKTTTKKTSRSGAKGLGYKAGQAKGKHLVIVESPSKAKTINKYLGSDYVVLASVGHVRDLPSKSPKGDKRPVPGVDLEKKFTPTYEVLKGKEGVIRDLKRAAKDADDIWFATDLDREGEAIAWHLAEEIGVGATDAKRVIFPAITKKEIDKAFHNPHPLDLDRVNAQQARRILDRIVGYQVSPLLWKKVARGLSAGRVQSVAVRLVVEREREIDAFVPDEYWSVVANFALSEDEAGKLRSAWPAFLAEKDEKGNGPTVKKKNAWLADRRAIRAELVEVGGEKFEIGGSGDDLTDRVTDVAALAGLKTIDTTATENPDGKGPARHIRTVAGEVDHTTPYSVSRIEKKRTSSRPSPPFITSTLSRPRRAGSGSARSGRCARRRRCTRASRFRARAPSA